MSSAVVSAGSTVPPGRTPSYGRLFGSAAVAQIVGGMLLLYVGGMTLSLTRLVGVSSGQGLFIYAPWVVDGPWALAASIGWGALVAILIGSLLRARVERRLEVELSRALIVAAVGIGGYAPWLITSSDPGRPFLSLFLVPAVVRVLVFDSTARPRRLPVRFELSGRRLLICVAVAVFALVLPYSSLHPFSVNGSGTSIGEGGGGSTTTATVSPSEEAWLAAGLQSGNLPLTVTGVRLIHGPDLVISDVKSNGSPWPAPETSGVRIHVKARGELWIGYHVKLDACPTNPSGVTGIRITYTQLGMSLEQTVSLAGNDTLLTCNP
jgi:hypothetical protein